MKEFRGIISVLLAAVLTGIAISAYMLYQYSPSGRYFIQNTLLAPSVAGQMAESLVAFDYVDAKTGERRHLVIEPTVYALFYARVSSDESVVSLDNVAEEPFTSNQVATLSVVVKPQKKDKGIFSQIVQFAPQSDYYRIQLEGNGWAYFYHPQIYPEALRLLTEP